MARVKISQRPEPLPLNLIQVRSKYGRATLTLHVESSRFEMLEVLLYGESMEWAADVLRPLLKEGDGIVDVNPGVRGVRVQGLGVRAERVTLGVQGSASRG